MRADNVSGHHSSLDSFFIISWECCKINCGEFNITLTVFSWGCMRCRIRVNVLSMVTFHFCMETKIHISNSARYSTFSIYSCTISKSVQRSCSLFSPYNISLVTFCSSVKHSKNVFIRVALAFVWPLLLTIAVQNINEPSAVSIDGWVWNMDYLCHSKL